MTRHHSSEMNPKPHMQLRDGQGLPARTGTTYYNHDTKPDRASGHIRRRPARPNSPPLAQDEMPQLPQLRAHLADVLSQLNGPPTFSHAEPSPPQTPSHRHATLRENHPDTAGGRRAVRSIPELCTLARQSSSAQDHSRYTSQSYYGQQTPPHTKDQPGIYPYPSRRPQSRTSERYGQQGSLPATPTSDQLYYYPEQGSASTHVDPSYGLPKRGRPPARRDSRNSPMFHEDSYLEVRERAAHQRQAHTDTQQDAHTREHREAHTQAYPQSPYSTQYLPTAPNSATSANGPQPVYPTPHQYPGNTVVYTPSPYSAHPPQSHHATQQVVPTVVYSAPFSTDMPPGHQLPYIFHPMYADRQPMPQKRRGNLPKHATDTLKSWLADNIDQPYPTEDQKLLLARQTNLTLNQISNWFINGRRRLVPKMKEQDRHGHVEGTHMQQ